MQRLMALTAALMGSAMLATTAYADSRSHRGFGADWRSNQGLCRALENRVKRCDGAARLGTETRASCDRTQEAYRALCGALETIVATDSSASGALDLLRHDYEIVPIDDAVFPYSHLVIGPTDLADPGVVDLVQRTYRAGKTVAITAATEAEVRRFHRFVHPGQAADCVSAEDPSGMIELYGLQQSPHPSRTGSYCLRSLDDRAPASDRRWLRERFATKVPGQLTPTPVGDASSSLANLATGKTCSYKGTKPGYANASYTVQVWAARNFASKIDYYLVNFNSILTPLESGTPTYIINGFSPQETDGSTTESIDVSPQSAQIVDTDPQTVTAYVSSYSNSSSTTITGSIGFDGDSVSGNASESTTTENATTTSVPPTIIENNTDPITLEPGWEFLPQGATQNADFSPKTAWVWELPKSSYPLGGQDSNQLSFDTQAAVEFSNYTAEFNSTCNVTVPFTTWEVPVPVVTALSPTSASAGDLVTIQGSGLYYPLVTNVLIAGTAIPSENIDSSDSTGSTLSITVPGTAQSGPVQVETISGNSTNNPTLTIIAD
jgi:hypothetical protein